jgi:hypothetical protein
MWQCWSSPEQEGGIRSRGACGRTRALPSKEAGSKAVGHVAAPEPSLAGGQDLKLVGHVTVRYAHCLGLKHVRVGILFIGYQ